MAGGTASMVNPDLINAILELTEKDFLDLLDIRFNRPKGFRQITNMLGEEYIEIIDAMTNHLSLNAWPNQLW
jgi:hypothetical protein